MHTLALTHCIPHSHKTIQMHYKAPDFEGATRMPTCKLSQPPGGSKEVMNSEVLRGWRDEGDRKTGTMGGIIENPELRRNGSVDS